METLLQSQEQPNRVSVLIVEDDPVMQRVLTHIVRSMNKKFEIDCVNTGEEARFLIDMEDSDEKYDLVIADHFLLGSETGLDLWRHVARTHPHKPFLMTSNMKPRTFNALTRGESEIPTFLPKPFNVEDIKSTITHLLDEVTATKVIPDFLGLSVEPPKLTKSHDLDLLIASILVLFAITPFLQQPNFMVAQPANQIISSPKVQIRSATPVHVAPVNFKMPITSDENLTTDEYDYEIPLNQIRNEEVIQELQKDISIVVARANDIIARQKTNR